MRCNWVQDHLIDFIENELDEAARREVEEHLEHCELCSAELEAFEDVRQLLACDVYVEPSPFYWTRFNATLMQRLRGSRRQPVTAATWREMVPRLVPVAVALVCFGIGLSIGLRPTTDTGATPDESLAALEQRGRGPASGPVVSPRTKLLVESGIERGPLAYAADTLRPDGLDPLTEEPRMILATGGSQADRIAEMERFLEQRLLRD
jgi:anti-sigma factor RsiW